MCRRCRSALQRPFDPIDRFVVPDAGVVVGETLLVGVAAFAYTGPMRRALAVLKYGGARRLAPILAEAALPALNRLLSLSGDEAVLVPVPVHPDRLVERGYNQAQLLARELAHRARLPVSLALERTRPTTKQHRLNRSARLANLRGAFAPTSASPVPRTAILVDDIITTTATLEACASSLVAGGTADVYGLSIAREL
jgi:competence protein ComFC